MANKKISELPSATTPLDGTEQFECIQGGINKKVAKSDISTGGAGTPGGSDTQIQFNDGGAFGGDAGAVFNKTTNVATFGGLNLSGLTASKFLTTDGSKNLQSTDAATQAEMITGTENAKPATPLSVESKRSILFTSVANAATGSTDIDCGSKQEVCVYYSTVVTGAITVTMSNTTNLEILHLMIRITGSNIAITFPSTTRMARYNEVSAGDGWYQSTQILQISSVGTGDVHEFSFKKVGTGPTYNLMYDGPTRA